MSFYGMKFWTGIDPPRLSEVDQWIMDSAARKLERKEEPMTERDANYHRKTLPEMQPKIKDSGTRSEFKTGAVRDGQTGKGRMDLMPVRALLAVSKIMEDGAVKYDARNWEKGIPLSRYIDSGLRHQMKWLRGDRDERHLEMACWNLLCLLDTQERIADGILPHSLNDLPCNEIEPKDPGAVPCGEPDCVDPPRPATHSARIRNLRSWFGSDPCNCWEHCVKLSKCEPCSGCEHLFNNYGESS
jgi:hypothetical protein